MPSPVRFIIALAIALVICTGVMGHEAPSGFRYDEDCCSDEDCRQAELDEVLLVPGGWYVTSSGQTFAIDSPAIRQSADHHFHICEFWESGRTRPTTRCVYTPPASF